MLLEDKVAVVTGGARGIGKAIAQRFIAEGARVVIGDVLDEEGARTEAELGATCRYRHCDVGERPEAEALVAMAVSEFGGVDVCVNNAGILVRGGILELSEEDFDRVLRVNMRGVFLVSQAAARQMVKAGRGGAIVNMSSINALVAIPNQTAYTTSKGAVHQLTTSMAVQLAEHGIRVNAIGPGTIETDMTVGYSTDPVVMSRTPLGRPGQPSEIASIAAFLASDEASYVTGQTIYADGGRLALNLVVPPKR